MKQDDAATNCVICGGTGKAPSPKWGEPPVDCTCTKPTPAQTDNVKQDTLAGELERRVIAAVMGNCEVVNGATLLHVTQARDAVGGAILAALRTDGEANSRAVSGEAVERAAVGRAAGVLYTALSTLHYDVSTKNLGREGRAKLKAATEGVSEAYDIIVAALSASKPDDASALLKEATKQVAALLREWRAEMPSTAQLIDSIATEWKASGDWSEWDQERREALTKLALATDDLLARIDASIGRDGA